MLSAPAHAHAPHDLATAVAMSPDFANDQLVFAQSHLLDQRVFAIPMWRVASGELRALDSIEQIQDTEPFAMAESLGERAYNILKRTTSVHGGVRAGGAWQKPSRILEAVGVDPGSRSQATPSISWKSANRLCGSRVVESNLE